MMSVFELLATLQVNGFNFKSIDNFIYYFFQNEYDNQKNIPRKLQQENSFFESGGRELPEFQKTQNKTIVEGSLS